jgi:hypothetical protein
MRLDLNQKKKIYIYIHIVYMLQVTEQNKNLGSGEQNSKTSEQCLKLCRKIIKQASINKD